MLICLGSNLGKIEIVLKSPGRNILNWGHEKQEFIKNIIADNLYQEPGIIV